MCRAQLRHPGVRGFNDALEEVFPGCPSRGGYLYPSDKPGLGIDIDEKRPEYPIHPDMGQFKGGVNWTQTRLPDGTVSRP